MDNDNKENRGDPLTGSRRDFIRRASYAAPVLLSLDAMPSFAQQGSSMGSPGGGGVDPEPPTDTGPRPASAFDCETISQPIESDTLTSMCEITSPPEGELLFQDIIIPNEDVPASIGRGNVFGTCDSFVCNAS